MSYDLYDQELNEEDTCSLEVNPQLTFELYSETAIKIDDEIDRYYDNVAKLWSNVILEYKENPDYGIILDRLTEYDKDKFYHLMSTTPVIRSLFESKRRLNILINREHKKLNSKNDRITTLAQPCTR